MNIPAVKQTDSRFDIVKIILSVFIVAIHANLFAEYLYPWLRIAVPLFFMLSGYFFFGKLSVIEGKKEKRHALAFFVKRNLILYMFWFLALLPLTLYARSEFFENGIVMGILNMLRAFLFSSTFKASWYIMASAIGVIIIYLLSRVMGNKALLLLTGIVFVLLTLRSSYFSIFEDNSVIISIVSAYESVFDYGLNSFPVSLFWLSLGKCFAEKNFLTKRRNSLITVILSALMLYVEWRFVRTLNGTYMNDSYFFLVPLCIGIFAFVLSLPMVSCSRSICLRRCSTVIYTTHASLIPVLTVLIPEIHSFVVFFMILLLSVLIYVVIEQLSKFKLFGWLKYSY